MINKEKTCPRRLPRHRCSRSTDTFAVGLCWAVLALLLLAFPEQSTRVRAEKGTRLKGKQVTAVGAPAIIKLKFENSAGVLAGRFTRRQLIVSGTDQTGRVRDMTHAVKYEAARAGVVTVDKTGLVSPLGNGRVTVTARDGKQRVARTTLTVTGMTDDPPGFHHRIVPILDKYHCTGCHGKPQGQNGFKLSLFGFDPEADYVSIVRGASGRRISQIRPEQSLLLLKATGTIAHGGGRRFRRDSLAYKTVHNWIANGVPAGEKAKSDVVKIIVFPSNRVMDGKASQQLRVVAHFADGSTEDVTRLAKYESNEATLAGVDEHGLVTTLARKGGFAVTVSFREKVGVFRGTIPFGYPTGNMPKPRNFIDKAVFARLKFLGMPPSPVCNDGAFLRRVTIDLAGRLPTFEEVRAFSTDSSSDKRDRLIERLLDSQDYAGYFANKWSSILRNHRAGRERRRGSFSFHHWIRESFRQNKPYDRFVREIVTASGDVTQNPPVTWFQELKSTEEQVENFSQLFLGVRITCARCHHHPYERWSQRDYHSLAAFFSRVSRKQNIHGDAFFENRIYHKRGAATSRHPNTGELITPAGLGGPSLKIDPDSEPRQYLVDWLVSPKNPFFATVLVNRYWKHFFGRGIVEPEDDLRDTNPPSNPELLAALRKHFIDSRYDLKDLVRKICQSKTYQLSVEANQYNLDDGHSFARFYPRRLNAEVILDSIDGLLGTSTRFRGMPSNTRAVELPDSDSGNNEMLDLFGRPQANSPCECERSPESDLRQSLYLFTSSVLSSKLALRTASAAVYAADKKRTDAQKVREMYLRAYSRVPSDDELQTALAHLKKQRSKKKGYEDLLWALIYTKEFLYNH